MLITKGTYKKEYIIAGAGIFGSIWTFFARIFSSNAAKQLASAALQAGKTAVKDIGMKAIDVGKTVAIDPDKKLIEKVAKKLSTPKWQVFNIMFPPEEITKFDMWATCKSMRYYIKLGSITSTMMMNLIVIQKPVNTKWRK